MHGFISPSLCKNTGFSKDDLKLLFDALEKMFDFDRSASRGEMATRKLIIFEHNSDFTSSETEEEKQKKINQQKLGFMAAHKLFDKIKIVKKDADVPPREFGHYEIWFGGLDEQNQTIIQSQEMTQALKSDKTVITISVKSDEDLSLSQNPEWMS